MGLVPLERSYYMSSSCELRLPAAHLPVLTLTLNSTIARNITITVRLRRLLPELPSVTLDYGRSPFNRSKVALLIENRPLGSLAPLILHMIGVLPPDWTFKFLGSDISIEMVKNSAAIGRQVKVGKLDLTRLPDNVTLQVQEDISRFLTDLWVYDTLLQPAEWLLVYQTDSACTSEREYLPFSLISQQVSCVPTTVEL